MCNGNCKCKKKPIISKKLFVDTIESIQAQHKIEDDFSNALDIISDGYFIMKENPSITALIKILTELIDPYEYVSWWLYENVEKVVYVDKEPIDVSTPELLYDFLIKY